MVGYSAELFTGSSLGLLAHFIFKRYEPSVLQFVFTAALVGIAESVFFTIAQVAISTVAFLIVLSSSILYYRVLSTNHPLHHIPGPLAARASQLWLFWSLYRGHPRQIQKDMHERYGPVVRIGPNEVSIADAASLNVIYGGKPWLKGKSYSFTASGGAATHEVALSAIRDPKEHAFRRKIWDRAFSIASLKNYQPFITKRVEQLCEQLDRRCSAVSIDLYQWLSYLVFDVMTDLAWSGGGDAVLKGRDPDGAIASARYSLHIAGMTKVLPWLAKHLLGLPWIDSKTLEFRRFSSDMFVKRMNDKNNTDKESPKDVFYHLLSEGSEDGRQWSINALQADSRQVVTAGADTTVSAIAYLFFCLLRSPNHYKRLQKTIDTEFPHERPLEYDALAKLTLLDAYVNEALRLEPPIPFQNQRIVPESGYSINGISLPPGTHVRAALYAIARLPNEFSSPDEFRPERWLIGERVPNERFNAKASAPFILGPYHCVGRNFAMQEMRYTVASLVRRYNMRFADGFNIQEFEKRIEDRSVLEIEHPLEVIIERRQ
ncbi:cytochrome P450 [Rhizodiscina lignyota]|uniref:Cytochrome P450 n=1 Tax=Rhizodiscina lignyota TaxID=1504668 RepID=A0A9P4I2M3_9PEZI|nr:cytochrome P450 [Rhizodiscina lignyota]